MSHELGKQCFIICPIGEADSAVRKRSDQLRRFIIDPAVTKFGYSTDRADEMNRPGIITSHIIQRVIESDLVIADLTDKNANVFYELAIRHASRKPFIQLLKKGESPPFDVAPVNVVWYDLDLDSADQARADITKQVAYIEKTSAQIDTPISYAIDSMVLSKSGKQEDRWLADLLESSAQIQARMSSMESAFASSEINQTIDDIRTAIDSMPDKLHASISDRMSDGPKPKSYDNHTGASSDMIKQIERSLILQNHELQYHTCTNISIIAVSMRFSWPFLQNNLPKLLKKFPSAKILVDIAMVHPEFLDSRDIKDWAKASREISLNIRQYRKPPKIGDRLQMRISHYHNLMPWHGIMVDETHLFLGRADWRFRELDSMSYDLTVGQNDYRYYNKNDHFGGFERIQLFNHWFQYFKLTGESALD